LRSSSQWPAYAPEWWSGQPDFSSGDQAIVRRRQPDARLGRNHMAEASAPTTPRGGLSELGPSRLTITAPKGVRSLKRQTLSMKEFGGSANPEAYLIRNSSDRFSFSTTASRRIAEPVLSGFQACAIPAGSIPVRPHPQRARQEIRSRSAQPHPPDAICCKATRFSSPVICSMPLAPLEAERHIAGSMPARPRRFVRLPRHRQHLPGQSRQVAPREVQETRAADPASAGAWRRSRRPQRRRE
jgi:hypothetical protein